MIIYCINIIREACRQAWRNKKSYIFLSVTMILTFTIIGFYMVYNDSKIFNKYKNTMSQSSKIAFVQYNEDDYSKVQLFVSKLNEMKDTHYYFTSEVQGISLYESENIKVVLNLNTVPNNVWAYYWGDGYRAKSLNGNKRFSLKNDEIIITNSLYKLLESNIDETGKLYINISQDKSLKVADICEDSIVFDTIVNEDNVVTYYFNALVSNDCIKDMYNEIRDSIEIKKIILIALMIILGINMLSSFMNALNDRKYEIAIRRSVGASKTGIILQFLTEAFIVIFVNVLISIALIMMLLSSIKFLNWLTTGEEWIINITNHSVAIYFVCCIFLSLFFSVLFSILSTRVEVIKYIKNE